MDQAAAELLHALERVPHGAFDLEVRQRPRIARPGSAGMDAQSGRITRLPPFSLALSARLELDAEHAGPEPASASRLVGRKLDQNEGHACRRYSALALHVRLLDTPEELSAAAALARSGTEQSRFRGRARESPSVALLGLGGACHSSDVVPRVFSPSVCRGVSRCT